MIAYFASVEEAALTQPFAATAATVAGAGASASALEGSRALMRPLALLVILAVFGVIFAIRPALFGPSRSSLIFVISTPLIVVDFNYLRTTNRARCVWLATGIFVSIVNIFRLFLNIFRVGGDEGLGEPRGGSPRPPGSPGRLAAWGSRSSSTATERGRQRIYQLDRGRSGSVTIGRRDEADIWLPWDPECSRLHAELELRAGGGRSPTTGSSQNGTWVNELRTPSAAGGSRTATTCRVGPEQRRVIFANPGPGSGSGRRSCPAS